MKKRRVWRYYCDFCKKANCHAGAMKTHEEHCTNNPNRVCRMCEVLETRHTPLEDLIALLPDPNMPDTRSDAEIWDGNPSPLYAAIAGAMPILRLKADGCPVCVFAALRQAKMPADKDLFDLRAECRAALEDYYARAASMSWCEDYRDPFPRECEHGVPDGIVCHACAGELCPDCHELVHEGECVSDEEAEDEY